MHCIQDNTKTGLRETRWECVDWIKLAQCSDKWWELVNAVRSLRIPQNAVNLLTT